MRQSFLPPESDSHSRTTSATDASSFGQRHVPNVLRPCRTVSYDTIIPAFEPDLKRIGWSRGPKTNPLSVHHHQRHTLVGTLEIEILFQQRQALDQC